MLQVNNLTLSFGEQKLLDDITFNINPGERIGLVGRNGSGKTTILKLLTGQMTPDSGSISIPKNYTIGYMEQHLRFTAPTILQEACHGLKEEEKDDAWKAEKILSGLGFSTQDFLRSIDEFSGGYQVRLNLAKVLVSDPNLLLLDEPTNYLDILSIRWLTTFLRKWENDLMLITHDREFMNSVTTHTLAIHRKKIRKIEGDTVKMFEQIATEEEVYERSRLKEEKTRQVTQAFIDRWRAQATRAKLVQSRLKMLDKQDRKQELGRISELGFRFNSAEFKAPHMMQVKDISFGYDANHKLIDKLSVAIGKDDRICIVGKNGKGKTTLMKILQGELKPDNGTITSHPNCQIGYFGQTNIDRLNPDFTIEDELSITREDARYSDVRATCGAMMFPGNMALKKISVLSGGERSRVSLGKILLTPTNMLLLDEPSNHLDMESCDSLIAALDEFPGAVVIITHDEMFLHHLATRMIIFQDDRAFLFEGTYQDFLDKIGWDNEAVEKEEPKKKSSNKKNYKQDIPKSPQTIQREYHKRRKQLNNRITDLEKIIARYEAAIADNNEKLIEAAVSNNGNLIKELQITNHKNNEVIDCSYKEMEDIINEIEDLDKEYQKNGG